MKEVNPKKQIHEDWLKVKAARDKAWNRISNDPCFPGRRRLVKEWNELFEKEKELYKQLTK